jgi:prepilin-type N-terminal cleavage/methylation domain-containing protein
LQSSSRPAGQPASRPTGFSLVELIISLAILSVGLVGAMRVFPVGLRASQRAEFSSRAAMAAQRTIESLKLQPWDTLADGQTTDELDEFDVTTRISEPASLEHLVDPSRLKTVQVSVQGQEGERVRTLTFVTYLRRDSS